MSARIILRRLGDYVLGIMPCSNAFAAFMGGICFCTAFLLCLSCLSIHAQLPRDSRRFGKSRLPSLRVDDRKDLDEFNSIMLNPAFSACWDALNSSSSNQMEVTKSDYVLFLNLLSKGSLNITNFEDLTLAQVAAFYSAACYSDPLCQGEGDRSIELASNGTALASLIGLCYNVMQDLSIKVVISVGMNIQYDPKTVPEEGVSVCLERATQSLLWDSFGCDVTGPRRLDSIHLSKSLFSTGKTEAFKFIANERPEESSPERKLDKIPGCGFDVTVEVQSAIFIQCPNPNRDQECGSVSLEITITTSQLDWPYADSLQDKANEIFYLGLKTNLLASYFPPGCL